MKPLNQRPFLGRRRNPVERTSRIVALYASGLSVVEVGRRVGASGSLVHYTLERAGVKLRSRAEGRALGMRRAARRQAIAAAAQKRFGHLFAPVHVGAAPRPAPVNELFADEAFSSGVSFDVADAWVAGS